MNPATLDVLAHHGGRGDGGFFIFPFLLFLLLIVAVVMFVRRRRGTWPPHHHGATARSVLDERFARGEIDRAEYEHRRAVLEGDDTVPPAPAATATAVADPPSSDPLGTDAGDGDPDDERNT